MTAEQRILAWLERADFNGTGCRWSQENIAAACGCSRRTVIRATQKLAAEGRIHTFLERRPGCKWPCRVYRVKHWNPHKRAGVLNVLRAIQERREAQCHTERTATASRAQTPPSAPFPRCTSLVNQRCGRERFEIRRSSMDQRRRPQHITVVPDLTAQPLLEEIARKDEIIRTLSIHNTELTEKLSDSRAANEAAGKVIRNLETQITRQARRSARSEQVEAVIEHWKKHRPKTKASSFPPGGKNWQTIEKALSLMAEDEDGPVRACCEAIDGLHIAPWEAYGRRYMKDGPNRTLRNRLEHALGDETRIERCRGIVRRVRQDGADRAWELALVAQATYDALTELMLEQLGERRRGPTVPGPARFTVDGLRVREDGR